MPFHAALLVLTLTTPDPKAIAVVDDAIAKMGGATALRSITAARYEMMTQWQRMSFDDRPYPDQPSFERHSDLRDYTLPAWRNTRTFLGARPSRPMTDIVRSDVAIRGAESTWAPLSIAYVDERREVFAFTPERLLLLARDAGDLRSLPDTGIGGRTHARVSATIEGFPTELFFRRGDRLLAMARYRAGQPNDFGLSPWGEMPVEWWYSRWGKMPNGVSIPLQWDIRRVERPYKRITVLAASFDKVAVADSFPISDSLRAAYLATATKAMHDVPLDSARIVDGRFATFGPFGYPAGAVKIGGRWVLIEPGQVGFSADRATSWLGSNDPGSPVAAALVTWPSSNAGGVTWLAEKKIPIRAAPGAVPFVSRILRNHHRAGPVGMAVAKPEWLRVGTDSLWLEPIDLPDAPGSLIVYSPTHHWAYAAMAAAPLQADYVIAALTARGWTVSTLGSLRGIANPVNR